MLGDVEVVLGLVESIVIVSLIFFIVWKTFRFFYLHIAGKNETPKPKEEIKVKTRTGKQLFILHGIPMIIYTTVFIMGFITKTLVSGILIFFGGFLFLIIPLTFILPEYAKGNKEADRMRVFLSSMLLYPFSIVVAGAIVVYTTRLLCVIYPAMSACSV